jgi:polyisoprenoid-binding protein YceI
MALQKWDIDPSHSGIHFTVRHMVIAKVHGRFTRFRGSIELDEQNQAGSRVSVDIDAASIDTSEEKRDAHLRSADFLDAEKSPQITFRSTGVELRGKNDIGVTGELTVHGVTNLVTMSVEILGQAKDPWGNERAAFSGSLSLDRKDYGLRWNQALEAGGWLVGDRVDISLEIEAVKAAVKVA